VLLLRHVRPASETAEDEHVIASDGEGASGRHPSPGPAYE